jgi:lipid-binding SYLF domain-containing protein
MRYLEKAVFFVCVLSLIAWFPNSGHGQDTETERIETAIRVLKEMVDKAEDGVPPSILHRAQGLAIIPNVIRAAYGIGGQYGKGLVMIRTEAGEWSNPCFIQLAGGSLGWQIGVQEADILLAFKSREGVEDISQGKVTLGADVRVTAGPKGRSAEASTDLEFKEEIYSYSQSRGLFAGISIQGASLLIDNKANGVFYGNPTISAREILVKGEGQAPAIVQELKKLVASF